MGNSQNKNISLDNFNWMIDSWVMEDENGITHETWTKESDMVLRGSAYTLKNGDTTFSERTSIEKRGNEIYYIAIVGHNPGPVEFKLTSVDESKAVFENSEHDFPQKITYINLEDGSLFAEIEGKNDSGKVVKIDFLMKKER